MVLQSKKEVQVCLTCISCLDTLYHNTRTAVLPAVCVLPFFPVRRWFQRQLLLECRYCSSQYDCMTLRADVAAVHIAWIVHPEQQPLSQTSQPEPPGCCTLNKKINLFLHADWDYLVCSASTQKAEVLGKSRKVNWNQAGHTNHSACASATWFKFKHV